MPALADTDRLLDLLHEAGPEAVTLDELHIAGVQNPAAALLALEVAGHGVMRVREHPGRGRPVTCVRLARPGEAPPTPSRADSALAAPMARPRTGLLALAAALLLVLLAARR